MPAAPPCWAAQPLAERVRGSAAQRRSTAPPAARAPAACDATQCGKGMLLAPASCLLAAFGGGGGSQKGYEHFQLLPMTRGSQTERSPPLHDVFAATFW